MKKITTFALVALMLLTAALPASAAIKATSVEVRGTVWNGTSNTTATNAWGPQEFAGFFYDVKDNLGTETLAILQGRSGGSDQLSGSDARFGLSETRTIGKSNLTYNTTAQGKRLKVVTNGLGWNTSYWNADTAATKGLEQAGSGKAFDSGNYYIIGWQAEKYVALNGKVDKLAKLILEQGSSAADKKTLTVGESWEVGDGWTLTANSIDAKASPRQVWLTLSKDGVKKDDKVVTSGGTNDKPIYTYVEKSLAGENDVPVFVTYVDSVFAGATTDMVQLRYSWLISSSVTEIKSGDTYGKFKDAEVDSTNKILKLKNSDSTLTLSKDTSVDIMGKMKFKVADNNVLRFYPVVIRDTPGTYEVRGQVWNSSSNSTSINVWSAQSFAGFFYDVKDNLGTETLAILQGRIAEGLDQLAGSDGIYGLSEQRTIGKSNLTYNTTAQGKRLKVVTNGLGWNTSYWNADTAATKGLEQAGSGKAFDQGNYYIIGWQAEKYVALNGKVDKLSKLILEQGSSAADKKTLTVGESWEVGDGWTLTANSIDAKASPRQVWLTLSKDGVKKDDKVVTSGGDNDKPIYTYVEKSLAGENDVPVFVTYVDSVFAGATTDMVQLRYSWLISSSVTEVKSGDTYGKFKDAEVDSTNRVLKLKNSDSTLTLSKDTSVDIMGSMKFKVADSNTLRFYPYVEYVIEGGTTTTGTETPSGTVVATTPKPTTPGVTTPGVTTPGGGVTTQPPTTVPPTATPKKTEPGFEAVFAIAGLLAVAFLVLRQRK